MKVCIEVCMKVCIKVCMEVCIKVHELHHVVIEVEFAFMSTEIASRFVGHRLATKLFIGKLLATRGVWVIIG